jgi:hypothetical protein
MRPARVGTLERGKDQQQVKRGRDQEQPFRLAQQAGQLRRKRSAFTRRLA